MAASDVAGAPGTALPGAAVPRTALTADDLARVEARLADTDELLATVYPGDDGSRQPVHTVYVPADTFTPELPAAWGRAAEESVTANGGFEALAVRIGVDPALAARIAPRVREKLARE
ncbi:DUF6986 family protein, partial [Agromyces sp. NPDC055657]